MSKAVYYGFNPPFLGGPQNVMSRQEDDQLIKNDILQFLMTLPGERVMRPNFGIHLRDIVFEPADSVTVAALQVEISDKLLNSDGRLRSVEAMIVMDAENHGMTVHVLVQLNIDPGYLQIEQFIGFASGP